MSEINQAEEIFNCIKEHGPIEAEDVAQKTGWIRHVVDVAIELLIEHGLVSPSGRNERQEVVYKAR